MRLLNPPPLPGWLASDLPFQRRFGELSSGLRVHFIDEGPPDGPPVLLVHGNPTWSYLWRKVIARLLVQPRLRIVAPDLLGFGLSDKPRRISDHSLAFHVEHLAELAAALDLRGLTIAGQDWGGPISAGVALRLPDRVRAAVFANTAVLKPARPFRPKAFHRFSQMPLISELAFRGFGFPLMTLDRVQGDRASIGPRERRAYRYPLRRFRDRAGPLALARMVPDREGHPSVPLLDGIGDWAECFRGPTALVWGTNDPILGRALRRHRDALPHAAVTETPAGHFLQEEVPDRLADAILGVAP